MMHRQPEVRPLVGRSYLTTDYHGAFEEYVVFVLFSSLVELRDVRK